MNSTPPVSENKQQKWFENKDATAVIKVQKTIKSKKKQKILKFLKKS